MSVKDATRKLVFEITPEDVLSAKQKDKRNCVIACAIRSIPGVKRVEVGATTTKLTTLDARVRRYQTPSILSRALSIFDSTGAWKLPAGVYELNPPKGYFTQGAMRKQQDKRKRHDLKKDGTQHQSRDMRRHRTVNARVLEFARIRSI